MIEKVKTHLSKNKKTYVACGVTAVGVAGITWVIMRRCSSSPISSGISGAADHGISVIGKKVSMNNVSYVSQNRQGSPSWVVRCLDNDLVFTSQRKAALEMGIPESELSKHLNGLMDDVRGFHFERICMAA